MSHSGSDEGEFLGLEEHTSFVEDVVLQEPLVQEELQGAHGAQEVAPQVIRTPVDPALEPAARGSAGSQ